MNSKQLQKYDPKKQYPKSKNSAKKGGFVMNFVKNQGYSKACKNIFSQITEKLAKGNIKSVMSVSKPIEMCDSDSYLQIIANQLFQLHKFLKIAFDQQDPILILKWLIVGSISGITANLHNLSGRIPLDPLLGQTFQGQDHEGTNIYIQCVARQPPTLIVIVKNQKSGLFIKSFYYSYAGINGVNSVYGGSKGKTIFIDKKKRQYIINHGDIILDGVVMGEPIFNLLGSYKVQCPSEKLEAQIKFDGYINDYAVMKVAKGIMGMFYSKQQKQKDILEISIYKIENQNDKKLICKGSGCWLSHIEIDGLIFWKYKERHSTWFRSDNLLASDSKYRQDKRFLISNKLAEAQKIKIKLEQQQRSDQLLRENNFTKKVLENKQGYD